MGNINAQGIYQQLLNEYSDEIMRLDKQLEFKSKKAFELFLTKNAVGDQVPMSMELSRSLANIQAEIVELSKLRKQKSMVYEALVKLPKELEDGFESVSNGWIEKINAWKE